MSIALARIVAAVARRAGAVCAVATVFCVSSSVPTPWRADSPETGAPPGAPEVVRSLIGAESSRPVSLLACGDILLSRSIADRIAEYGYQWPFRNTRDLVSRGDIAFCNLENPVSFIGSPCLGKPENVTFRADPGALFGLKWAGFDVVSLANNHMNDYGPKAIRETLEYLDMLGIAGVGAGVDAVSARTPAVIRRNGAKIAFLGYVQSDLGIIAAGGNPGVNPADKEGLREDIELLKAREHPDYIVVSVHWGEEYQSKPSEAQRDFGRAAIDAGATLVLGHHPHVLQSVEVYGAGVIVYSLGNFVFDMAADATYDTAVVTFTLAQGKVQGVEILPLRIERYDYAPRPATPAESERILSGLAQTSKSLGTTIEIQGGRGLVRF